MGSSHGHGIRVTECQKETKCHIPGNKERMLGYCDKTPNPQSVVDAKFQDVVHRY
jgi:hypothetical protein